MISRTFTTPKEIGSSVMQYKQMVDTVGIRKELNRKYKKVKKQLIEEENHNRILQENYEKAVKMLEN